MYYCEKAYFFPRNCDERGLRRGGSIIIFTLLNILQLCFVNKISIYASSSKDNPVDCITFVKHVITRVEHVTRFQVKDCKWKFKKSLHSCSGDSNCSANYAHA